MPPTPVLSGLIVGGIVVLLIAILFLRRREATARTYPAAQLPPRNARDPYEGVPPEVAAAIRGNRVIEAIKLWRGIVPGLGLKDAKDLVDEVRRRVG